MNYIFTWAVLDIQAAPQRPVPQRLLPELPALPGVAQAGVQLHLVAVVAVRVQTLA